MINGFRASTPNETEVMGSRLSWTTPYAGQRTDIFSLQRYCAMVTYVHPVPQFRGSRD